MIFLILLLCFNVCVLAADSDDDDLVDRRTPSNVDSRDRVVSIGTDSDDHRTPSSVGPREQLVSIRPEEVALLMLVRSGYMHCVSVDADQDSQLRKIARDLTHVRESLQNILERMQRFEERVVRSQPVAQEVPQHHDLQFEERVERRENSCMQRVKLCPERMGHCLKICHCGFEACSCIKSVCCSAGGNVTHGILAGGSCIASAATACIGCIRPSAGQEMVPRIDS